MLSLKVLVSEASIFHPHQYRSFNAYIMYYRFALYGRDTLPISPFDLPLFFFFFFNDTATTEISPLPLHDALPISSRIYSDDPAVTERDRVEGHAPIHTSVNGHTTSLGNGFYHAEWRAHDERPPRFLKQ